MVAKKKPEYIKLKEPCDVMKYIQRILNKFRRNGVELEPEYTGKIIYLLNTWLSAYKTNLECIEVKEIKARLDKIELEYKDGIK